MDICNRFFFKFKISTKFCQLIIFHSKGGVPSPFDRSLSMKLASKALNFMLEHLQASFKDGKVYTNDENTAVVIGMRRRNITFTSVSRLHNETDFEYDLKFLFQVEFQLV